VLIFPVEPDWRDVVRRGGRSCPATVSFGPVSSYKRCSCVFCPSCFAVTAISLLVLAPSLVVLWFGVAPPRVKTPLWVGRGHGVEYQLLVRAFGFGWRDDYAQRWNWLLLVVTV